MNEKTHWLQSPNKNYLGHWDLPNGDDLVLTIKSAKWEKVKNPVVNTEEAKRVVRFEEDVKPFICNQTNAQTILKVTGTKFMEDSAGKQIQLFVDNIVDKRTKDDIDCIRIRPTVESIQWKEELEKINTTEELKEYYQKNKGKGKEFDKHVSIRKAQLH